ncbi:MAG: hypothetical protein ACXWVJ_05445 [Caulobacteraceae bacterium]
MDQVHFEIFARRPGGKGYVLEAAMEDRAKAMETAEDMLVSGAAVAVKVTKEMLDRESGEFKSLTILKKGEPDTTKAQAPVEDAGPLCVAPPDLYTAHARERIGMLLEGWLARQRATPFELLHRAELIERLEAAGVELQHAMQKLCVPEAQARKMGVHEVIRHFQGLTDRAMARVTADDKRGAFPNLDKESFAAAATRLLGEPDRMYFLGGGVANYIGQSDSWTGKLDRLLDLAEKAPEPPKARAFAFSVLEQPLGEILGSRLGLSQLLGPDLDLGGSLAALTRLAASEAAEAMIRADAGLFRLIPVLEGTGARLAKWLDGDHFLRVREAIAQRVLRELKSPLRLRPSDPRGEIDILRALAMSLTAAAGKLIPLDDVREAFVDRSAMLVTSDFVGALTAGERPALEEARDLIWLTENVIGAANKRAAARWLSACIGSLKFESEMMANTQPPIAVLSSLAELQRQIRRHGADNPEIARVEAKVGEIGGAIENRAKLVSQIGASKATAAQKLDILVRMATGTAAPLGPAADRSKVAAMKLLRLPDTRQEIAESPEALAMARTLMQAA